MSCKLLLNLVDCIKISADKENTAYGRELLMRMLEVFVLKFKTIAKIQLPHMMNKYKQQQQPQASVKQVTVEVKTEGDVKPSTDNVDGNITAQGTQKDDNKSKFGFPQNVTYNVADYRNLVKTLVCSVKNITWGIATCKVIVCSSSLNTRKSQYLRVASRQVHLKLGRNNFNRTRL